MTRDDTLASHDQRELITFFVGDQHFCMDIMLVREIRGWTTVTPLPHAPADVMGVMNLRGAVVPIVDLAARLSLAVSEPHERHVIIIAAIGVQTVGFLVTAVSDIVSVKRSEIQSVPDAGGPATHAFVEGVIASHNRTLRVLGLGALGNGQTITQAVA